MRTSFIFWVIGCSSPRYFAADCAAFAYEFKLAWYYISIKELTTYLFEEFLLDGDVVVSYAENNEAVFRLF